MQGIAADIRIGPFQHQTLRSAIYIDSFTPLIIYSHILTTLKIDRKNILSYIPHVIFPMRDRPDKFHNETLMDGELVTDVDGDKVSSRVLVGWNSGYLG